MKKIDIITGVLVIFLEGCSLQARVQKIQEQGLEAGISLYQPEVRGDTTERLPVPEQTVLVSGKEMHLIHTVQHLQPAVVTADVCHIAERNGTAELMFHVIAPAQLLDPHWQLRFSPSLISDGDTLDLDDIVITGRDYRRRRPLSEILLLSGLRHEQNLNGFIERFIPLAQEQEYLENPDRCTGLFGVSVMEARDYFGYYRRQDRWQRHLLDSLNRVQGIRLDTLLQENGSDFDCPYFYRLQVRPGMRKVRLSVSGEIYEHDRLICRIPSGKEITYYISSLTYFVDWSEHFRRDIRYARLSYSCSSDIRFRQGESDILPELADNCSELARMEERITDLLSSDEYAVDSILVRASCSPEGSWQFNRRLARLRSRKICRYLSDFIRKEYGVEKASGIHFLPVAVAEDWDTLKEMIEKDSLLTDRRQALKVWELEDVEKRAAALSQVKDYERIQKVCYPLLRQVRTTFRMHRKNMVRDTLCAEELDRTYMEGLEFLKKKDYEMSLRLLRPYSDLNAVVCHLSNNHDLAALAILEDLPDSAFRNYLMALTFSRLEEDEKALRYFQIAVSQDYSLYFRGSLDPEVKRIKERYEM